MVSLEVFQRETINKTMKQVKNISNNLFSKISEKAFDGSVHLSITIHEWLLISSFFSCLLLLVRIIVTSSITFIFLGWNLFLAFIPYWITWWTLKNVSSIKNKFCLAAIIGVWLLFIPNS